jgi:hypothetical protein
MDGAQKFSHSELVQILNKLILNFRISVRSHQAQKANARPAAITFARMFSYPFKVYDIAQPGHSPSGRTSMRVMHLPLLVACDILT